jgi:hypothetical protein
MGVADSPLRDRVLFVQGAPRSGTTWLSAVLATHPAIAGVLSESHLFDRGVNQLFDNIEGSTHTARFLTDYLPRTALVDLVRDLCDGVFLAMRDAVKPDAGYVVEKTPFNFDTDPRVELGRKLETYPDAWYLHIARDGEQVVRSLARTPFAADRTPEACLELWRASTAAPRELLAGNPRFMEVGYDELRSDPVETVAGVLGWIGVPFGAEDRDRVQRVSQERFAQFEAPAPAGPALGRLGYLGVRARDLAGRGASRLTRAGRRALAQPPAAPAPAALLLQRARQRDLEGLRAVTTEGFVFELRSAGGDLHASGDAGRDAVCDLMTALLAHAHVGEAWSNPQRPGPVPVEFIAFGADGSRHDVAFHVTAEDGRVTHLKVISAGDPAGGRPSRPWNP